MSVYFALAIFVVLLNLFPVKNERQSSVRLLFSFFIFFMYGAFRVDYGLDYPTYESYFQNVKLYGVEANERIEFGYYLLNKLLPSYRGLLIIQTLLLCSAYYFLFKWYIPSKWAWLGFLLLFLNGQYTVFFMLTAIRNGIAISIFILSTYFIHQRKIIPFLILVFIAYWFHNSVILYAPLAYIIANGKTVTTKTLYTWLSIMIIIALASNTFLLSFVETFVNRYFNRYSLPLENVKELGKNAGMLASLFALATTALLLFLVKDKNLSQKENMMVKLSLLFLMANLLGPLNMRMTQYFASFFMVGSIVVIYKGRKNSYKYAYIAAISLYLFYALNIWLNGPYFSYDTYRSLLF